MDEISDLDRDALERCLIAAKAESPRRAKQIDLMLASRPWLQVAKFACLCAQSESLGVLPYQNVPMYARMPDLERPFGDAKGEREAAEIMKKLVENGCSIFEPDPLKTLDEVEQRATAK